MKFQSLRWRILLPPLIALLVGGLLLNILIPRNVYQFQIDQQRDLLARDALTLANLVADEPLDSNFNLLTEEWAFRSGADILILSPTGSVLGSSTRTQPPVYILNQPEMEQARVSGSGYDIIEGIGQSADSLVLAQQITRADEQIGYIHITYRLDPFEQIQSSLRQQIWLGFLLIAVLALVPLAVLAARSGQRLEEISRTADQIANGNLNSTVIPGIKDEVGELASGINKLASALDDRLTSLQEEQKKINAVVQQMNEGVIILDDDGKISLANPAAKHILGIAELSLVGSRLIRVTQNHQILELWENYTEIREKQSSLIEMHDQNKIIQISIHPLEDSNEDLSMMVIQDLTQLRMLQTIRRDFISNISHELRTPIASLKALAETLQISALDDPDATRRFLDRMEIEIEALAQMVSELLELTRIESGQVPLELQRIDANRVLQTSIERIAVQAERAGLTVTSKLSDHPAEILADPPRLEQVLVNILHNATKFTPSGGKIDCRIKPEDQHVLIMISDNGPGIPIEDRPRIFERFYKSKRPKQGSGTGLGLSIAKHLIEAHGGKIWGESQMGTGSTFIIQRPRQ